MLFWKFLVCLLVFNCLNFNIHGNLALRHNFSLCESVNKTYSLRQDCNKLSTPLNALKCEIFILQAKLFINDNNYDDSFNYVNTPNGKEIVYINKGHVFGTECIITDFLMIPTNVKECTLDLPVFIKNKIGDFELVFLINKNDIFRRKTKIIDCSKDFYYENEEFSVNRFDKTIYIKKNEKNKTLFVVENVKNTDHTITSINLGNFSIYNNSNELYLLNETEFNKTVFQRYIKEENFLNSLYSSYESNIDSNTSIKIFRDLFITSFIIIIIILLSKNKVRDVAKFLIVLYKKKYGVSIPLDSIIESSCNTNSNQQMSFENVSSNMTCQSKEIVTKKIVHDGTNNNNEPKSLNEEQIIIEEHEKETIKFENKKPPQIQQKCIIEFLDNNEIILEAEKLQERPLQSGKRKPGRPRKNPL